MNYLLLCGLSHGKLINVRPERVEHEFVNSHIEHTDRLEFTVDDAAWRGQSDDEHSLKGVIIEVLRDWGTSLAIPLYEEALTHLLGGEAAVVQEVDVCWQSDHIGRQKMHLATPQAAFRITNIHGQSDADRFERQLQRLLAHTRLECVHWINMTLRQVTFRTVFRQKN